MFFLFAILVWLPFNLFSQEFRHPGVMDNQEQLDFIRKKVADGAQPWKSAYDAMVKSQYGSPKYKPSPFVNVNCGPTSNPDIGCSEEKNDVVAAYTQALLWKITGNPSNADAAIRIMDAWANTLKTHGNYNARLESAWTGTVWARTAEIMRRVYKGWPEPDLEIHALPEESPPMKSPTTIIITAWACSSP